MEKLFDEARLSGVCCVSSLHHLLVMKSLEQLIKKLRCVLRSVAIQRPTILVFENAPASLQECIGRHGAFAGCFTDCVDEFTEIRANEAARCKQTD